MVRREGFVTQSETRKSRNARREFPPPLVTLHYANDLERIPQLRARLDPRRACPRDEAGRTPVGRLVPAPAPRVLDADQAEALVPDARPRGHAGRDRARLRGDEGPVPDRRGRRPRGDRARRRLALDRDHALRQGEDGRPDLLRPHVLPRPGSRAAQRRPYVLLLEAMRQTETAALGRFVRARPREPLPRAREGRRARARDAVPRRGRLLAGRDRRGRRGDRGEEAGARARACRSSRASPATSSPRSSQASTGATCARCSRRRCAARRSPRRSRSRSRRSSTSWRRSRRASPRRRSAPRSRRRRSRRARKKPRSEGLASAER